MVVEINLVSAFIFLVIGFLAGSVITMFAYTTSDASKDAEYFKGFGRGFDRGWDCGTEFMSTNKEKGKEHDKGSILEENGVRNEEL